LWVFTDRQQYVCVFAAWYLAMLPILENAQHMALAVKRLEAENSQLKAAIEQHEVEAKRQGNAASAPATCSALS